MPSHVQKTFVWTVELVNNLLPTNIEPIQPIWSTHVYVYPKTYGVYAQHESLMQITLFFEQTTLVAQT